MNKFTVRLQLTGAVANSLRFETICLIDTNQTNEFVWCLFLYSANIIDGRLSTNGIDYNGGHI